MHPLVHVVDGDTASRTTAVPFDFLFFDFDTTTDTFDDFAVFVGAVTVTFNHFVFDEYRSTVRRVLPLTLIVAFPPVRLARNQSVAVRDFTV
jgi:hypothetical protein